MSTRRRTYIGGAGVMGGRYLLIGNPHECYGIYDLKESQEYLLSDQLGIDSISLTSSSDYSNYQGIQYNPSEGLIYLSRHINSGSDKAFICRSHQVAVGSSIANGGFISEIMYKSGDYYASLSTVNGMTEWRSNSSVKFREGVFYDLAGGFTVYDIVNDKYYAPHFYVEYGSRYVSDSDVTINGYFLITSSLCEVDKNGIVLNIIRQVSGIPMFCVLAHDGMLWYHWNNTNKIMAKIDVNTKVKTDVTFSQYPYDYQNIIL